MNRLSIREKETQSSLFMFKGPKGNPKKINFGDVRYEDFRQHKDQKRRTAYLKRAKGIKMILFYSKGELTWKLKDTANYWSTHYLWAA